MIINPVVLNYEENGKDMVIAFDKEFVENWLNGVTDGQQDLDFFLADYTNDDVQALITASSRKFNESDGK